MGTNGIFVAMTIHSKIGIDIGRVIIAGDTDQPNTFFSRDFLEAPAVDDAIPTIAQLAARQGPENVFLISKCGEATAERSLLWLHHQNFFELTGIAPDQVYFCRERHEKRIFCDQLEIDMFIDDRYTVLQHLLHLPHLFLFNPSEGELEKYEQVKRKLRNLKLVQTWKELAERITA